MKQKIARFDYSKKFLKQLKKAPLEIKIAFRDRFTIFIKNPNHPLLNNHPLKGRLSSYRSINITGDWRALYSECFDRQNNKIIIFEVLGTHSQLYK